MPHCDICNNNCDLYGHEGITHCIAHVTYVICNDGAHQISKANSNAKHILFLVVPPERNIWKEAFLL